MLEARGAMALPPYAPSEFDHGDVYHATGRVFVAHTEAGTVEALDGAQSTFLATIPDCPEASGVLCAQDEGLVFAAARGAGYVQVIDADTLVVQRVIAVDPRPNGLAWDSIRRRLLVADVQMNTARLITPEGDTLAVTSLPGRPRWCLYEAARDRFLVNIREPACVAVLAATTATLIAQWPVSAVGPHGLAIDAAGERAFVACDDGRLVALDLATGNEGGSAPLAGPPDVVWYNPQREHLYVASGEPGMVEVIDTRTMTVEQQLLTEEGAHTTAYDDARQRLYVFLPAMCQAAIYEEV
ncbi:MAG TPA: YncE family protein [Ktedonobacterales bacterium]|nr:YncE family protein [Ktedonobacterales bacterium]